MSNAARCRSGFLRVIGCWLESPMTRNGIASRRPRVAMDLRLATRVVIAATAIGIADEPGRLPMNAAMPRPRRNVALNGELRTKSGMADAGRNDGLTKFSTLNKREEERASLAAGCYVVDKSTSYAKRRPKAVDFDQLGDFVRPGDFLRKVTRIARKEIVMKTCCGTFRPLRVVLHLQDAGCALRAVGSQGCRHLVVPPIDCRTLRHPSWETTTWATKQ